MVERAKKKCVLEAKVSRIEVRLWVYERKEAWLVGLGPD